MRKVFLLTPIASLLLAACGGGSTPASANQEPESQAPPVKPHQPAPGRPRGSTYYSLKSTMFSR